MNAVIKIKLPSSLSNNNSIIQISFIILLRCIFNQINNNNNIIHHNLSSKEVITTRHVAGQEDTKTNHTEVEVEQIEEEVAMSIIKGTEELPIIIKSIMKS